MGWDWKRRKKEGDGSGRSEKGNMNGETGDGGKNWKQLKKEEVKDEEKKRREKNGSWKRRTTQGKLGYKKRKRVCRATTKRTKL